MTLNKQEKGVILLSKRIGLTMSDELVRMVDKFADLNNISRAAAICVLCSQALSQSDALETLKRMMDAAETNSVPEKKVQTSYTESILCKEK